MAKSKRADDDLFPDTGPAKPAKKPTKKVEKPEKAEKSEKPKTRKVEKPERREEELPAKKAEKLEKPAPPPEPAPRPVAAPSNPGFKLLVAGVALVAIGGGAVLLGPLLLRDTDDRKPKTVPVATLPPPAPQKPGPKLIPVQPLNPTKVPVEQHAPVDPPKKTPVAVAGPTGKHPGKKSLKELAEKSANHGAVARILELYDALKSGDFRNPNSQLLESYQARQKREQELIEQLRQLGPTAVDAMKDVILNVDDDGYKILLAKALGGMSDPDAIAAVKDLLKNSDDIAVKTTLVRFLTDGTGSAGLIAQDFADEQNPSVRAMLLREYARRLPQGSSDPTTTQLFRDAATGDPDPNVRAEAVSIIGRRADPNDMGLMQQIASNETNLQIRQSAIVALATTGGNNSLGFLQGLVTQPDQSLEVSASAVLAIARVGTPAAVQILDQIASTDTRDQIRSRATTFANGLRARQQQQQQGALTPVPINPKQP
ncbi:MAG TPA: HEAT repeat domain-containing protein [Planctomycetota bacterium]|nr:HEAT repeat domain-containing protein [Planctomycetota bacterium]